MFIIFVPMAMITVHHLRYIMNLKTFGAHFHSISIKIIIRKMKIILN